MAGPLRPSEMPPEERLRRYVVKRLRQMGAGNATDDLASEVMVRYLRHRPGAYKPWLERVMRNLLIDGWRKGHVRVDRERRTVRFEGLPPSSFVSDPGAGPPAAFPPALLTSGLSTPVANRDVARRLLDALTPAQRPVVLARYWEGLSSAEIAVLLGYRTAAVVDSILDRAERRLRDRFPDGPDAVG